jgi:uncharacterized protein
MQLHGLAAELFDEISKIPVVDSHEHLPTEAERTGRKVDVTTLFSHYCKADLSCAGLLMDKDQDEVFDTEKPLGPRWEKLKPAFQAIRYGSYAYPALAYVRDILGFDDINDETVGPISKRLQADNTPGLYSRVMKDICGIETAIQCIETVVDGDQDFFVYLCRDRACGVPIESLATETGRTIHTLDQYVGAMGQSISDQKAAGAVGYKVAAAYYRRIDFPDVARSDAERVFVKLRAKMRSSVSDVEMEALENYLIRRAIEACVDMDMPVVIHTGYHAGVHNDIRNARATHLWSILNDYPDARFDLFHGSFPYVEDMTCLGKYFENVSLNMCWMHIMGPDISRHALSQWLDAVPVTKIFAFGGDYGTVEKIYGHLKLARSNVASVLADKVTAGRFTTPDALHIARLLFNENPKRWYKLG